MQKTITELQTLINEIIDTHPLPPISQNALTKEEATERIKKDRNNLKWAISGFIRNKYLGK